MTGERFRPAAFGCQGCGRPVVDPARRFPLPVPLLCGGCQARGPEAHRAVLARLRPLEERYGVAVTARRG